MMWFSLVFILLTLSACRAEISPPTYQFCRDNGTTISPPFRIQSHNYPNNYDDNLSCTLFLSLNETKRIKIHIEYFDTEFDYDYIEIGDRSYSGQFGDGDIEDFVSNGRSKILLRFRTDSSNTRRGFSLIFDPGARSICGLDVLPAYGQLMSPNYTQGDGRYANNVYCQVRMNTEGIERLKIHFVDFNVEYGRNDCQFDYLDIAGVRYCGRKSNTYIDVSDLSNPFITFVSDSHVSGTGFLIRLYPNKQDPMNPFVTSTAMTPTVEPITSVSKTTTNLNLTTIIDATATTIDNLNTTTTNTTRLNTKAVGKGDSSENLTTVPSADDVRETKQNDQVVFTLPECASIMNALEETHKKDAVFATAEKRQQVAMDTQESTKYSSSKSDVSKGSNLSIFLIGVLSGLVISLALFAVFLLSKVKRLKKQLRYNSSEDVLT